MIDPVKKILVGAAIYLVLLLGTCLHRVEEGHVVLLKRCGKLQKKLYPPGFHLFAPFVHQPIQVSTIVQTDSITDIPCGTSSGMLVHFTRIEVVNRLLAHMAYDTVRNYSTNYEKYWLHDKVHHEVNQFCSRYSLQEIFIHRFGQLDQLIKRSLEADLEKWAPGIQIIAVRVTKPLIGKAISKAYRKVEKTKAYYRVVEQRQRVMVGEITTRHMQLELAAKTAYEVRLIQIEKELRAKQIELQLAQMEAGIRLQRNITKIDNQFTHESKLVSIQPKFLSKQFLKFYGLNAVTSNIRLILGPSIPKIMPIEKFI